MKWYLTYLAWLWREARARRRARRGIVDPPYLVWVRLDPEEETR